ncbi:DUF11 domain-containing protein [Polaribacter pectinis]|uniref:DUF11 domain-containing protein n=1 Tax=Polaribacter pectinis TaxID=2738844 RepID=A0A7G9L9V4_9FLAO|nr:DUF11 domain-containing protein [Polaribacter pectinis]QNM85403.1 DUF11 domain-containing protein [Polaribacter pectinis]
MKKKYLLQACSTVKQFFLLAKSKTILNIVLLFVFSFVNTITAQDSFETDFDGWLQVSGDDMNWTRDSLGTPSSNTGPSSGSDGDFYLFIEASNNSGKKAWLEKEFDLTGKQKSQLNFDYHMYGSNMGTLNVLVNKNGVLTNVFSRSGDKGNAWQSTIADLSAFDGDVIKIRFEGIVGGNFRSDAAIDNISVTSAPDTDGDGVIDDNDADADNDGILDVDEGCNAVTSSSFSLVPAESVLGNVNAGGKLVYKDAAGNKVVLEAAGTAGSNNVVGVGPSDGTIITDINTGQIVFEIGANGSAEDQPKLKVTTFSADGVPFQVTSIGLVGIGNMDNSEAQDAIAIDIPGTWSNLTSAGNTLGSAQITTSPIGATPVNNVTQTELDNFDFTNFVEQGAVSEVIFNNADNNVQFGYNATFSPTNPTSSFNLIVDDINIDDGVGRNIVAELSTTSISVAAIYCRDTDSDGIPDYLDTDSDGDGCSDADEAYFGTVTNADTDDNGTYGSGTPTVDGVGKVSGAAYTSPNSYYIDASVNACFDNDNDGVPDSVDLDDDNDGILDSVEENCVTATSGSYDWDTDFGVSASSTDLSGNLPLVSSLKDNQRLTVSFADNPANPGLEFMTIENAFGLGTVLQIANAPGETGGGITTFSFTNEVRNLTFTMQDIDARGNDFKDKIVIQATKLDGSIISISEATNVTFSGSAVNYDGNNTFVGTGDVTNSNPGDGVLSLTFPEAITEISFQYFNDLTSPNTRQRIGIADLQYTLVCDTDIDKDGIPNSLDLDSDNDGCFDAIEGADNLLATAVDSDGRLTGTVNNQGVPNNVNQTNGQPIGTSLDQATRDTNGQCDIDNDGVIDSDDKCDGFDDALDNDSDGVPDGCDLDDDNDGITDVIEGAEAKVWDINGSNLSLVSGGQTSTMTFTTTSATAPTGNDSFDFYNIDEDLATGVTDTYTITSTLPLREVNFQLLGLGNSGAAVTSTLGNFVITLADGTVVNDADFRVMFGRFPGSPFNIGPPVTEGVLKKVTIGGKKYVEDATNNTSGRQATGFLQFPNEEALNKGIVSIQFDFFGSGVDPLGIQLQAKIIKDTDKDGITDDIDSDSDGDGCSDADEAYYGSVNNADADNNGFYGSGTPAVDNSNGKVSGASYSTPNANYLDASVNTCLDNDNDGVADFADLDDDNDGIIDTAECATFLRASNGDFNVDITGSNPVFTQSFANSFSITYTNTGGSSIAPYSEPIKDADELYAIGTQFKYVYPNEGSTQEMTFSSPVKLKFMVTDIDQLGEKHRVTVYDKAGAVISNPENYIVNTAQGTKGTTFASRVPVFYNDLGEDVTKDGTLDDDYVELSQPNNKDNDTFTRKNLVFFDFKELEISKIVVQNLSTSGQPGFLFDSITAACDTDLDGIPDYQDTDSDNDGCPDAIEAAGDIQLSQLTAFAGGSVGGSLDNLGLTSDAEGNPIVSGAGYEQNNTAAVLDANDKTACSIDLSVTKTVNKPIKKVGEKIVFTITLKNDGNQPATNVNVIDLLPTGLTYDAATTVIPTNTTYDSSTGIWDLSLLTLAKGSSYQLKIGATVNTAGTIYTNKTEVFSTTETDIDSTPNSNN